MALWNHWLHCVLELRPACSRLRSFLWLVLVLASMSVRSDLAGVTSCVRGYFLRRQSYPRLLHLFHSSAIDLERLTHRWVQLVLRWFDRWIVRVEGRVVLIADGIKIPKEGKKMPGVKSLHQDSATNAKAEFIMGHSCQAVSLLVAGIGGFFAIPLASRIHEGIVFSNRDQRSLLDKLMALLLGLFDPHFYLVADAYYASAKVARPLRDRGDHLITRVRTNGVGYRKAHVPQKKPRRGRPQKYGPKVALRTLFEKSASFQTAISPIPGEKKCKVAYRAEDLLWRPLGELVRFVAVDHPHRGRILLMTTDLSLHPMKILELYALRFKIEVSFKQAVHTIGTYAYHFWMRDMKPIRRRSGNQYLHRETEKYRESVRRKIDAYHRHIQIGIIVQGLLQYLALSQRALVWRSFGSWMRTMRPNKNPSERVVAQSLRHTLPEFLVNLSPTRILQKFLIKNVDISKCPGMRIAS